jgi:hypothetical protein
MSTLNDYRIRLSLLTMVCSIVMAAVLLAELSSIFVSPHISHLWLVGHSWLWRHSDEKSFVRLFIDSWLAAIGLLIASLGGLGTLRRVALIVSGANVLGFPALFFALLAVSLK